MNNTHKQYKGLWIAVIVLHSLAILTIILATVLMFLDVDVDLRYNSYTRKTYATTVTHPEGGIMPLFSLMLCCVSIVLFVYANIRYKKSYAICTILINVVVQILLLTSISAITSYKWFGTDYSNYVNISAYGGYGWGIMGAGLLAVAIILNIIYVALYWQKTNDVESNEISNSQLNTATDSLQNKTDCYGEFQKQVTSLKSLVESEILTEEEYLIEKKKLMKKYNIGQQIDGTYKHLSNTIVVSNDSFIIKLDDLEVKRGSIKTDIDKLYLIDEEGKQATFIIQNDNLIAGNGVIYEKQ